MSVINIHEPCRTFSTMDYKDDFGFETNEGYVAYFNFDDTIKIEKIIIDKIEVAKYWNSQRDLVESIPYVSFSYERKHKAGFFKKNKEEVVEKISFKTKFYTDDFYSMFWPSNYINMNDIGETVKDAVIALVNRDAKKHKYREYFN